MKTYRETRPQWPAMCARIALAAMALTLGASGVVLMVSNW